MLQIFFQKYVLADFAEIFYTLEEQTRFLGFFVFLFLQLFLPALVLNVFLADDGEDFPNEAFDEGDEDELDGEVERDEENSWLGYAFELVAVVPDEISPLLLANGLE